MFAQTPLPKRSKATLNPSTCNQVQFISRLHAGLTTAMCPNCSMDGNPHWTRKDLTAAFNLTAPRIIH
jgi:hypothetical protein